MLDFLHQWLCRIGFHSWTPWEDKNIVYGGAPVDGRTCRWCGTVQNRCVRAGGDS